MGRQMKVVNTKFESLQKDQQEKFESLEKKQQEKFDQVNANMKDMLEILNHLKTKWEKVCGKTDVWKC